MLAKNMYPKCAESFKKWLATNNKYTNFYLKIGEPTPFDVTLRDGLQGLSKVEQQVFTTNDKLKLYNNIKFNYNPKNIEIGSVVSEKVLPIFGDTLKLLQIINNYNYAETTNNYIVIPNKTKLNDVISNSEINHFSLITSVSDKFQIKNTKMSLEESDNDINTILNNLNFTIQHKCRTILPTIKLYVSCINECPIEGKIDNDFIVNRLLHLSKMNIDYICLSDTCGTLLLDDFDYIVEACLYFGLQPSRIVLHLHVNPERENDIEQIIWRALDYKIINFDVSNLKTGGCSVTMDAQKMYPNLSYDLYYKALCKYIIKKNDI